MKGLLKKFSDQMYGRMKVNDTYEELWELAYTVENVTLQKEINEEKQENSFIAGISLHAEKTDQKIRTMQKKILDLEESAKNKNTNSGHQTQDNIPTVAAVSNIHHNRSTSAGRPSRPPGHLQFKIPLSRSQSTDSNYDRGNSYNRKRSSERRFSQENNNYRQQSRSPGPQQGNPSHTRQDYSQHQNQSQSIPQNQYQHRNPYYGSQSQTVDPRSPQPAIHPQTFPQRFQRFPQQNQSNYQQQPPWQRNPTQQGWAPQDFVNQYPQRNYDPNIDCHHCGRLGHIKRQSAVLRHQQKQLYDQVNNTYRN